jgi:hypothetical protein
MNRPPLIRPATLLAALLCGAAAGATVRKVDDSTVAGDLIGVADGKLLVAVAAAPATRPAAPPTTRPTAPPTTRAVASTRRATTAATVTAATVTTAVPLADVAQVSLRDPPALKPQQPVSPTPAQPRHHSRGLFSALVGSVFGTSDDDSDNNADPQPATPAAPTPPTPAPRVATTGSTAWLVVLVGGDRLHGMVPKWDATGLSFTPAAGAGGATLAIPLDQVAELWLGDAAEQAKARGLMPADVGADDVAFVRKDPDAIVPVKGTALKLAGDAVSFRYEGRDRRLATAKLVGLVLGNHRAATPTVGGAQFTARLGDGDGITGEWVGLDHDRLTLRTAWGQSLPLAVSEVYRVVAVGGRLTYLSDLRPARVEQVPFFGRPVPYRIDHALSGGPIRLADGTHDKGIAVHARCVLEYDLGGKFDRLRGEVGFEQPDAKLGSAAIRVTGDGRTLFDAPGARGDQPPAPLDLDVTGVRRLSLVVDFGPGGQGVRARVDWADVRLLRGTGTTGREKRP